MDNLAVEIISINDIGLKKEEMVVVTMWMRYLSIFRVVWIELLYFVVSGRISNGR